MLAGDIEENPGLPNTKHSLTIAHWNIRSIRNKVEFIENELSDHDTLCFTESHLDDIINSENIKISDRFNSPLRKNRTNHGGGILVYLASNLIYKRREDLEVFWNENIWVEIETKREMYLLGCFYSPSRRADHHFFNKLNLNIEKAYENTKNIVIVGDINEDLFNPNFHPLSQILLVNSMINVINDPTRLDPIIIPDDLEYCDSGTMAIPVHVSDHKGTYITLPYHYELNSSFERIVWMYKRANFELLNQYIRDFDWNCLLQMSVNEACEFYDEILKVC